MAALTCSCSPAANSSCRKEASAPAEQQQEKEAALYEAAKSRSRGKIMSRRIEQEEEAGGGKEEVWEGAIRREIGASVEEVWDMLGDFSGMKRWNAIVEVCEVVEGTEGEVGCVRYCAGGGRWVKEKLVELHPVERCFTYTIIDSSYGFQGYVATLSIRPLLPSRTLVHWTFQLDPVPNYTEGKLLDLLTFVFDRMMCSVEEAILSAANSASVASAGHEDVAN